MILSNYYLDLKLRNQNNINIKIMNIEYSLSLVSTMISILKEFNDIESKKLLEIFLQYIQDENFKKMSESVRRIDLSKVSCLNNLSSSSLFLDIIYPE